MAFIWAVREEDGNWSHWLDNGANGIVHVVHGYDGQGDLNVEDYKVERINRSGFDKVMLTHNYVRRLGTSVAEGGVTHDGHYVYER